MGKNPFVSCNVQVNIQLLVWGFFYFERYLFSQVRAELVLFHVQILLLGCSQPIRVFTTLPMIDGLIYGV